MLSGFKFEMDFPIIIFALFVVWLGHWAWCLDHNYVVARSYGLPILICPIDPDGFPYVVFKVPLRPLFKALLPKAAYQSFQVSIFGWQFLDKDMLHARIGSVFPYVTPGDNELWIADPVMAYDMLSRRKDFGQPAMSTLIMSVLGPNILSSDGDSWARQRKLVAPNLNERIMQTVWSESQDQAKYMLDYLLKQPGSVTLDTISGLRTIAINVIGLAGYGQKRPWTPQPASLSSKEKLSYSDSIYLVMLNLLPVVFFPPVVLKLPFMPESWRLLGKAKERFPEDTKAMLEEERQMAESRDERAQNFMTMLVSLSTHTNDNGITGSSYLSEEEIQGNLFSFTGAGFDTTSNAMSYAVTMLAAYPQWQIWMQEELDQVIPDPSVPVDYRIVYPQLHRCLAVMYETLRLFPPLVHIAKQARGPQSVKGRDGTYHVSANVKCYFNTVGLHTERSVWGEDALEFKPCRWFGRSDERGEVQLFNPPRGSFLPWSSGPRNCPGQKMSQVEFTATMGTLFRSGKVEPAPKNGCSDQELRQALLNLAQDSQPRTTLQMNRPEEVVLKWTSRA